MGVVRVRVDPVAGTCKPETAKTDIGEPTIFMFKLLHSGQWEWQPPSPVVVTSPHDQFETSFIHPKSGLAVMFDRNTNCPLNPGDPLPLPYEYRVTVVRKKTKKLKTVDPFIQNQ